MIELYTRINCPACVSMKKALSAKRIQFTERVIDRDIPTADVVEKFPGQKKVPILAVGKHVLGGVDELQSLIENDHLKHLV